jgi:hypothetical protein
LLQRGFSKHAGVAELVDALDLGSSGESRGGSSPSARTTNAPTEPGRGRTPFIPCQCVEATQHYYLDLTGFFRGMWPRLC